MYLVLVMPCGYSSQLTRHWCNGSFLLALVTGWLGGELVNRLGVGVDTGAHLDAPSSLSGHTSTEIASHA